MDNYVVKLKCNTLMEILMKESGIGIKRMEMEFIQCAMDNQYIRANLEMICGMGLEYCNMKMEITIKDILEMVRKMGKENLNMLHQEIHIQDSLERIKEQVKE